MTALGLIGLFIGSVLLFLVAPFFVVRSFWRMLKLDRLCLTLGLRPGFVAICLYATAVWAWWEHWQLPAATVIGAAG